MLPSIDGQTVITDPPTPGLVPKSTVAVAVLLIATILAGCAGADPDKGTVVKLGDGSSVELPSDAADSSSTKGAISGVVVDEAIRPLAGSTVQVAPEVSAVTDDTGVFIVTNLEPGLYTLTATLTGYLPIQTTAEVVAGDTAKVRIVLATDNTPQPRHTTLQFDGFMQAGNGLVNQAWQLFVAGIGGVPVESCKCQFYFQTEGPAETFVIEVTWEPSVPRPTGSSSGYYAIWDDGGGDYVDNGCENPCFGMVQWAEFALPETVDFHTDIWLESDWVYVNQAFKQYVTIFYGAPAPENWSFLDGDP